MLPGLLTAFAAALCYGVGSVLQAAAARRAERAEGLDVRFLARLLGSWQYVLGLGLDLIGFLLALVAVRSLPLFVVQAVLASFLAVTAVLGAVFLKMPLDRKDRYALGLVVLGLVLVGASASEDRSVDVSTLESRGVLVVAIIIALAAVPAARYSGARSAAVLGTLAGLAYGVTAVGARMLPAELGIEPVLRSPAAWALALAGVIAVLTYSIALQRGSVTEATAPVVVGETVGPALVGLLLLGDQPRPGWGWVGAVGFVLAVAGAVGLSRHGEVAEVAEVADVAD